MSNTFLLLIFGGILLVNQMNGIGELLADTPINAETQTVVAIGSANQVKIQAVKNAFINESVQIVPCSALSNVRSQPLSEEETLQGAINRAKDSLEKTEAQLAIGLEAGIFFLNDQVYLCHWGAIVDRDHNVYFTNGPIILLPDDYREALLAGRTLDEIMHDSTGIENLGTKEGAVAVFTRKGECTGHSINREEILTQIVRVLIGQYRHYQ